ncbi:MAG: transposase [Desulfobulbus sp.]|nr:transposase [Desulfobulbus sp.]
MLAKKIGIKLKLRHFFFDIEASIIRAPRKIQFFQGDNMKRVRFVSRWHATPAYDKLMDPAQKILPITPPLRSKSNKPLTMTTDDILNILVYYHLNEFSSGRELLQNLEEDEYSWHLIAPAGGVKRSTFFDTVNKRCVEQFLYVFCELQKQAAGIHPTRHIELGELVAVDGSFTDSVLSMTWAEYQTQNNKAKLHLNFDLPHGIPLNLVLTDGNGAERPQVNFLVQPSQTGGMDRRYQDHEPFDQWHKEGRHFICRIKENTHMAVMEKLPLTANSSASFAAKVILGVPSGMQTEIPVRVVGFELDGVNYLISDRPFRPDYGAGHA